MNSTKNVALIALITGIVPSVANASFKCGSSQYRLILEPKNDSSIHSVDKLWLSKKSSTGTWKYISHAGMFGQLVASKNIIGFLNSHLAEVRVELVALKSSDGRYEGTLIVDGVGEPTTCTQSR